MTTGGADHASAQTSPITAIDIALEPDQTMVGHAQAANALLLKNFPKGFSLDATHHPHVSIFAGFVPTADLPKVYTAADAVSSKENYTAWKLTAFKYYYIPLGPIGLGGIVVEPTPDLLRLQQELIDAVGAFTVKTATARQPFSTRCWPRRSTRSPSRQHRLQSISSAISERRASGSRPSRQRVEATGITAPRVWRSQSLRENTSPVVLHIDDRPTLRIGLIDRLVEFSDSRVAIIGPFPSSVGVVYEHREARALSRRGPLQHLEVPVGIAERRDRATADVLLDCSGLFDIVVNQIYLQKFR